MWPLLLRWKPVDRDGSVLEHRKGEDWEQLRNSLTLLNLNKDSSPKLLVHFTTVVFGTGRPCWISKLAKILFTIIKPNPITFPARHWSSSLNKKMELANHRISANEGERKSFQREFSSLLFLHSFSRSFRFSKAIPDLITTKNSALLVL